MAYRCLVGPLADLDIVHYARSKTEDLVDLIVPDSSYQDYAQECIEEFSRWSPIGIQTLGNVGGTPPTSPLVTIPNQNKYVCNAANGFDAGIQEVVDVLYRASGVFTAASEIAYLALMPVSPLNWFRIDKDLLNSPSSRHLRDQYLQELDHYGIGYWRTGMDVTGVPFIYIYPPPTTAGLPIFVHYTTSHALAPVPGDLFGSQQVTSIPNKHKQWAARLMHAIVIEQEADRLAQRQTQVAGMVRETGSARELRAQGWRVREQFEQAMGSALPVALASY